MLHNCKVFECKLVGLQCINGRVIVRFESCSQHYMQRITVLGAKGKTHQTLELIVNLGKDKV